MSTIYSLLNAPEVPKRIDEHDDERSSTEEEDLTDIRAEKENKPNKKYISWSRDVGGYDNRSSEARLHAYLMRHNAQRLKDVIGTSEKRLKLIDVAKQAEGFFRRRGIKYRTVDDLRVRINGLVKKDYRAAYNLCHSPGEGAMGTSSKSGSEEFKDKVESLCYGFYELEPYMTDRFPSIGVPFDEREKAFRKRKAIAADKSSSREEEESCSVVAASSRFSSKKKQKRSATPEDTNYVKLQMIKAFGRKTEVLAARSLIDLADLAREQGYMEDCAKYIREARKLLLRNEE